MRILSLETATYFGGMALLDTDANRVESAGPFPSRGTSRELMNATEKMMKAWGWTFESLDGVAVSTGPGLFTGVRVGQSIAKTLCWAGGGSPPLAGVSTLRAVASLAAGHCNDGDWIAAATDARRGEIYAGLFEKRADGLERLGEDIVVRPERLRERLLTSEPQQKLLLVGDATVRYADVLKQDFAETGVVDHTTVNLAEAIARVGAKMIVEGKIIDPASLEPHYVRRPDARKPVLPGFLQDA
jgi:tRNA threonylcarbamoyladenosine biosynthesis protein TsaB